MSSSGKFDRWARWLRLTLSVAAMAVLTAAVLAGCGGGSSSTSGGAESTATEAEGNSGETEPASNEEAAEGTVSEAELQQTVNEALSSEKFKAAELEPLVKETFERATPELTSAQLDQAYECWKGTSCTLGDGPITLGFADNFSGNTWRQFTKMNVILEALTHPEVGKFIYTDANYDLATYQANLRSLTAQGANAIVTPEEYGPAAYSAFAAAQREGAKVATFLGQPEKVPANALTAASNYDLCETAGEMAAAVEEAVGSNGPVAFFEGLAGSTQDAKLKECLEEEGVEIVFTAATEYTPSGAQKAASALISSGKPAKAILYTYSNVVPGIVDGYLKAGEEIPTIVTLTQSNETICQMAEHPYPLYVTNSANWSARIATNAAIAAAEGEEVPRSSIFPLPFYKAEKDECEKGKSAEYPGPALVPDSLTEKMLAGQ
jgi:ABC-type sugar transport system substrate-binding protein